MPEIRITFLGTSASVPTKDRGLPAVFLEYKGQGILFDVGEGTQRQFMRFGRSVMRVEHILISHYHGDHLFGLPGLLSTLALYGREKPVHIWVPVRQVPYVEAFLNAIPMGVDYPVYIHGVDEGLLFHTADFTVYAYPLEHTSDCYAYVFEESPKVKADKKKVKELGIEGPLVRELKAGNPVYWKGRTISPEEIVYTVPGRKIVYAVDTCPIFHERAVGADVLIHDATFLHDDHELAVEKKHSTVLEAAELAKKLNARLLVLTHFSARIKDLSVVEAEARKVFEHSVAARDGYTIEL
ncbi:MAG: ribonuclease [Candidatus Diapherotrites archaeon]|nr:ribonuclease [Candidatus Diapherotrites archaeon]MDN5366999.1 ribonuclease [Candidatus Diapherotrites archaeon]